jgi:hypothetical protein
MKLCDVCKKKVKEKDSCHLLYNFLSKSLFGTIHYKCLGNAMKMIRELNSYLDFPQEPDENHIILAFGLCDECYDCCTGFVHCSKCHSLAKKVTIGKSNSEINRKIKDVNPAYYTYGEVIKDKRLTREKIIDKVFNKSLELLTPERNK